jgi:hypothetical protein
MIVVDNIRYLLKAHFVNLQIELEWGAFTLKLQVISLLRCVKKKRGSKKRFPNLNKWIVLQILGRVPCGCREIGATE